MSQLDIFDAARLPFLGGKVELRSGDCLEVLAGVADSSVDSVVTDPPYALVSITKRFGKPGSAPAKDVYGRGAAGFMGKAWDTGDRAFTVAFWGEVFRVLKPGGHVVAFGGTRTYHRLAVAIEDAGFEIRDQLGWVYGSGFPKSHNAGNGWGTALKPAWEPICLARKPLEGTVAANVMRHGTGALNVDGCRVATDENLNGGAYSGGDKRREDASSFSMGTNAGEYKQPAGRWPANLVHDGSAEVLAAFPESGNGFRENPSTPNQARNSMGVFKEGYVHGSRGHNDSGSAARFFYTAKADSEDRLGSKHPTVKPLDLMQWLVRLVTPKGGLVLDPFAGTGTTGEAAWREGCRALLIEREPDYQADIVKRMEVADSPGKRNATAKGNGHLLGAEGTPLFGNF